MKLQFLFFLLLAVPLVVRVLSTSDQSTRPVPAEPAKQSAPTTPPKSEPAATKTADSSRSTKTEETPSDRPRSSSRN